MWEQNLIWNMVNPAGSHLSLQIDTKAELQFYIGSMWLNKLRARENKLRM